VSSFEAMWAELAPIGRGDDGGYRRLPWSVADSQMRAWFRDQATSRGLLIDEDRNGNQWAWWGRPAPGAVVTGSHLDSVPGGGAYDGPLGVVSGFLALDRLRAGAGGAGPQGIGAPGGAGVAASGSPARPVAVVNFAEEEGGRFGVACLGSRLLTGSIDPARAGELTDADGVTLADAWRQAGLDPDRAGADPERLGRIGTFVELHVEQGRRLADIGVPVGVATAVWPHGRWRYDFAGRGDHAGTTRLADRSDPVLPLARTVLAARAAAEAAGDAVATVGKLTAHPGAVNAIASRATAWLDARAPDQATVRSVVAAVTAAAEDSGRSHGVTVRVAEESWSGGADFGSELRARLGRAVAGRLGAVAELPTGAGHDAAVLAAVVPAAMLFVRNPTGTSHDPAESATLEDCLAGVDALTAVLEDLLA